MTWPMRRSFSIPVALALCIAVAPALAESDRLPLLSASGQFIEEMPDNPRVSGQRLAGVHLAHGEAQAGRFDPAQFRLALGDGVGGAPVCVRITTRDGRYWSLNAFATAGTAARYPRIDFRTALRDRLSNYDLSDFAVRATAQEECRDDGVETILPAMLTEGPADRLVFLINAGNPLSVGARYDAPPAVPMTCRRPGAGVTTGYNFICELPLEDRHGPATVTIAVKDRNGLVLPESYTVQLP